MILCSRSSSRIERRGGRRTLILWVWLQPVLCIIAFLLNYSFLCFFVLFCSPFYSFFRLFLTGRGTQWPHLQVHSVQHPHLLRVLLLPNLDDGQGVRLQTWVCVHYFETHEHCQDPSSNTIIKLFTVEHMLGCVYSNAYFSLTAAFYILCDLFVWCTWDVILAEGRLIKMSVWCVVCRYACHRKCCLKTISKCSKKVRNYHMQIGIKFVPWTVWDISHTVHAETYYSTYY